MEMFIRRSGGDRGVRRGVSSGVATPEKLVANLGAVWDASRGVVLSGSNFVTWADQVPVSTADTLTAHAGNEPTYIANDGGWPCVNFAAGQYFDGAGSSDIRTTATWSICMWVKITTGGALSIPYTDDFAPQRATLRFNASNQPFMELNGGATSTYATALTVGTWYHLAWVFDGSLAAGSRGQWYVNGVAVATANSGVPAALNVPTGAITVGSYPAGGFTLLGRMDAICIGKTAWTASDVVALYNYHRRS